MGGGRLTGDGEGAAAIAWRAVGPATGRIRRWLSIGGGLLLFYLSALGLAADVLYWRFAGLARYLCSPAGERVRGLEKDPSRELESVGSRHRLALEVVYLSCAVDDDDELRLTWHPGHVPDAAQTAMGV